MARPLRIQYPGAYYHVTCRGNERRAIFRHDADQRKFIGLLFRSLGIYRVALYVYVLMPNHFHLVLRTLKGNLSEFMRQFNISYTMAFNRMHGRVGHLYQGRYKALLIDADSYLMEVSRYVHLNPVRGDRFKEATVEEKWRYLRGYDGSSLRGYIDLAERQQVVDYRTILGYFGGDTRRGRNSYAQFVRKGLGEETGSPLEVGRGHGIVGGEEFVAWVKEQVPVGEESWREQPAASRLGKGVAPEELIERYFAVTGESREAVCRRGRRSDERRMLMELLYRHCTTTQREIGKLLGGVDYSTVSRARKELECRMKKDQKLARRFDAISNRIAENANVKI